MKIGFVDHKYSTGDNAITDRKKIDMPHFEVLTDTETAERIGASGTFQVVEILDEDGKDASARLRIDAGRHYHTERELQEDIASSLGVPVEDISLDVE